MRCLSVSALTEYSVETVSTNQLNNIRTTRDTRGIAFSPIFTEEIAEASIFRSDAIRR